MWEDVGHGINTCSTYCRAKLTILSFAHLFNSRALVCGCSLSMSDFVIIPTLGMSNTLWQKVSSSINTTCGGPHIGSFTFRGAVVSDPFVPLSSPSGTSIGTKSLSMCIFHIFETKMVFEAHEGWFFSHKYADR
jgi:hypothetical protein